MWLCRLVWGLLEPMVRLKMEIFYYIRVSPLHLPLIHDLPPLFVVFQWVCIYRSNFVFITKPIMAENLAITCIPS